MSGHDELNPFIEAMMKGIGMPFPSDLKLMEDVEKGKIDTLRLIVTWECNLSCPYCCNQIKKVQDRFVSNIEAPNYEKISFPNVCVTGGEPLLHLNRVKNAADQYNTSNLYLYTNGTLLTEDILELIEEWGYIGVNVGVHTNFDLLTKPWAEDPIIRFHIDEHYKDVAKEFDVNVKYYKQGDCHRKNEIIILTNQAKEEREHAR